MKTIFARFSGLTLKEGYQVTTANSAEEALRLDLTHFNLMLLDVMMDGMSGFAMASR
jgi:CheY-like chemotaxis protein